MADFPPAQYIDGYNATGNTISFTIDGYNKRKVASVSLSTRGSYTTPNVSVAFSGGSGSGASATALLRPETLVLSPTQFGMPVTSNPSAVQIDVSGNADATPIFGLESLTPKGDMFFVRNQTPTLTVSGANGSGANIRLDIQSNLKPAILVAPSTGTGTYPPIDNNAQIEVVDASNPTVVQGTVQGYVNDQGQLEDDELTVTNWYNAESRSSLDNMSLKLVGVGVSTYSLIEFYVRTSDEIFARVNDGMLTPTITTNSNSDTISPASISVNTDSVYPATWRYVNDQSPFTAPYAVTIKTSASSGNSLGSINNGSRLSSWSATPMSWIQANQSVTYYACSVNDPTNEDPIPIKIATVTLNNVALQGGGSFRTEGISLNINNVYEDSECITPASMSNFIESFSETTTSPLSPNTFPILAFKMPYATASDRIEVISEGNGYVDMPEVNSTQLYSDIGLGNNVDASNFNQRLILFGANLTANGATYTTAPTVTVSGGDISDSSVTKTLTYSVDSITLTNGGFGYLSAPSLALSGSVSLGGSNATATAVLSASTSISLPNLTENHADATTGDFREVCHALCELVDNIDTSSVRSALSTSLQTNGAGIIDKFTFTFDLVPETGALAVDPEP
jgi:hypothetical protein